MKLAPGWIEPIPISETDLRFLKTVESLNFLIYIKFSVKFPIRCEHTSPKKIISLSEFMVYYSLGNGGTLCIYGNGGKKGGLERIQLLRISRLPGGLRFLVSAEKSLCVIFRGVGTTPLIP